MSWSDRDRSEAHRQGPARLFIVLPTWNAGPYLDEQLASLVAQTNHDWTLLVRDDGSRDDTPNTLRRWAARDERITLLADDARNLGAARGFGLLLQEAWHRGADFVACCDQDDVWHPEKLARQVAALQAEAAGSSHEPLLAACGADLVDFRLRRFAVHRPPIANNTDSESLLASRLLRNVYPGLTLVANRALLEAALPLPPGAAMHDWWLVLVAITHGRIIPQLDALVQYRQHATNTIGFGFTAQRFVRPLTQPLKHWQTWSANQRAAFHQMRELALRLCANRTAPAASRTCAQSLLDALTDSHPRALTRWFTQRCRSLSMRDRLALRIMRGASRPDDRVLVRKLLEAG